MQWCFFSLWSVCDVCGGSSKAVSTAALIGFCEKVRGQLRVTWLLKLSGPRKKEVTIMFGKTCQMRKYYQDVTPRSQHGSDRFHFCWFLLPFDSTRVFWVCLLGCWFFAWKSWGWWRALLVSLCSTGTCSSLVCCCSPTCALWSCFVPALRVEMPPWNSHLTAPQWN